MQPSFTPIYAQKMPQKEKEEAAAIQDVQSYCNRATSGNLMQNNQDEVRGIKPNE